jgi:N-acetylglucosaminyl-diphospho-decaprenol L-rhamnosyltransferase
MSEATAVIPNWNLAELTLRCVHALVEDGLPAADVVVVDNGSTDDSVTRLRQDLPLGAHVLSLAENIGFARAGNAGASERPDSNAYLFVNNDAFVHAPGSVGRLLRALDRPQVGIAVPRLLNEDLTLQPSVVPLRSPAIALVMASGLSRFIPNRWQPRWSTHWDHATSRAIDASAGTVIAIRSELWHRLGGYVERELMYSEDIDICWRTRKAGYAVWFEAQAEFVHLGNASGKRRWSSAERSELVAQSDASMIRDELGRGAAAVTIGVLAAGHAARAAVFKAVRSDRAAAASAAAARGYLRRSELERR